MRTHRTFVRKGTFKVSKPRTKQGLANIDFETHRVDHDSPMISAGGGPTNDKKLRDMSINIKYTDFCFCCLKRKKRREFLMMMFFIY